MDTETTHPRRVTSSDIIDRLLAALARTSGERSSFRITRNAAGKPQIEVLVKTGEHGIETIEQARIAAQREYDAACAAYPFAVGGDSA